MSQEHSESNGTRNGGLNKRNFTKIHGPVLTSQRTAFKEFNFGRDRWMKGCVAINGSNDTPFDQIVAIDGDRPIANGGSRLIVIA